MDRNTLKFPLATRSRKRGLRGDSGSIALETALCLPIFLMAVFGLINFALVMFGYCNLCYANRYALRYACLHSTSSFYPTSTQAINSLVAPLVFQYPKSVMSSAISFGGSNAVGTQVTVSVTVSYSLVFPFYTFPGPTFTTISTGTIIQ